MGGKKFVPKAGQVDFTRVRWCPVINCVVRYRGKILLVQRSKELRFYPLYWNGISGFLDDERGLKEKVSDELREELGISRAETKKIQIGTIFDQEAPTYKKTWIVHPVLVDVKTGIIKLDWEARKYVWVTVDEALKKKLLPGFDEVLRRLFRKPESGLLKTLK